jgi:putative iron-dependent peroxidase
MPPAPLSQPLLDPVPALGRFLILDARHGADLKGAVSRVRAGFTPERAVLGLGQPVVLGLGASVQGLRAFPSIAGPGCAIPSTQAAVFAYFGGADAGEIHDRALALRSDLGPDFTVREELATFRYQDGRDLSGYLDGTANPTDGAAAAIVHGKGRGLDGASFVAVQTWAHDLARFRAMPEAARDRVIGRRHATNEEMADAPQAAHVKRAEQEAFDPPAFMVRRSMPWGGAEAHGLCFVAYGRSLDAFERVLLRMAGAEDGVVDALFSFSRPTSGGYYWCPPLSEGRLDLSALGL